VRGVSIILAMFARLRLLPFVGRGDGDVMQYNAKAASAS